MKVCKFLTILFFVFFITDVYAQDTQKIDINSNNAVLYNLNNDSILFEKNKDQKVSIASLTKMMTAIVVIENNVDLQKKVSFTYDDYNKLVMMDASSSSLDHTKSYTYEELLYGLILESGADCANALARLTTGDEKKFVRLMNEKAKELGMTNSSFSNPIGMDDKYNYSSVDDMATLFKYGLKNQVFKKIITSLNYELSDGTKLEHTVNYYMDSAEISLPYLKGGKTGFEIDAGFALASISYKDGVYLILVTSKGDKNYNVKDAKKLYDYYYNNYGYQSILKKGDVIKSLEAKYLSKDYINITALNDIKCYLRNDYDKDKIKLVYNGLESISFSNKYREKIGVLDIYYDDDLIYTGDVLLSEKPHLDYKLIIVAITVYIFILGSAIVISTRIRKKKMLDTI